jgi:ribosome maturation factor RimP
MFAYEKLGGLDREKLLSVVEPVLAAHGVDGVELIWRSDHRGWVMYVTIEVPGSTIAGDGINLDLCAEISRDLSAALDVADFIGPRYRLEVGSPGLERELYRPSDYQRFTGSLAKLQLAVPEEGQFTLRGHIRGLDAENRVSFESDFGEHAIDFDNIRSGKLVLDLGPGQKGKKSSRKGARASNEN